MIPVLLSWAEELPVAPSCPPFGENSQIHGFFISVPCHELCFKALLPGKSWQVKHTTAGLTVWVTAPRSSSVQPVPQSSGPHPTEVQQAKVQVSSQVNNRASTLTALHLPTVQSYLSHSILPHLSVLPIQTTAVWLRLRSYSNTHGVKASSPNPHTQGALQHQLLRHCPYGVTSPSSFTCHTRSLPQVPVAAQNSSACTVHRTGMRTQAPLPPAFGHRHLRYPEH